MGRMKVRIGILTKPIGVRRIGKELWPLKRPFARVDMWDR
jgi:hypothetical protein